MGTSFNTQTGPDGYRLHFSTENRAYFNLVQSAARHCVDGKPVLDFKSVVHGEWKNVYQDGACSWSGQCSVCRKRNDIPHPLVANYCPNCGAKMDA